ncbi:hypothetical protein GTV15_15190 [Streptomyces sp. SID7803]|nr:hypothetical protein [Streptomyces sp. SID7803]
MGYSRTKSVEAFRSSLQDDLFVLHFLHNKVIDSFSYSGPRGGQGTVRGSPGSRTADRNFGGGEGAHRPVQRDEHPPG